MATVYSNHCCLESWLWTSKLSVSFFVTQPCKCSLTIILSYTLLKLIEFCQVETSLVHVRAIAEAHALSMVMWYHKKIVVGQCWVMYTLETLALKKPQILNDVLMLYIIFANLLECHFVLLMHLVCPLYTFLKVPTPNLFTVHACLRVSHQLILLICGRRSRKGCSHRVCCPLVSPRSAGRLLC